MKLKDFKKIIDFYIERHHGDDDVVIYLDQPSVGHLACSVVKNVFEGIDFDRERFFIVGTEQLIMKDKDRDIGVVAKKDPVFKRKYVCSSCGGFVCKGDNYCCSCGQKLLFNKVL